MDRINMVYEHPVYQEQISKLVEDEADRIFCRHDLDHLLDVARLMYIYDLEYSQSHGHDETPTDSPVIDKELIYAAALLHDIGRHCQYETGEPHDEAGTRLAARIMNDCGYTEEERTLVCDAIIGHRHGSTAGLLAQWLYRADKESRPCFSCEAREECNWPSDKMNLKVRL